MTLIIIFLIIPQIASHVGTNPMFRDSCHQTQAVGIADSLLEPLGAAGSAAGTIEPPWCVEIFIEWNG